MDELKREIEELKRLILSTNGNGKTIRHWLMQITGGIVAGLVIAGSLYLFGLSGKITATAEAKAESAIKHHSEVLEPRLTSIESSITGIQDNISKIADTQQSMGQSLAALQARAGVVRGDETK